MSSNEPLAADANPPPVTGSTAAADVSFAKLNSEHHAETKSQASSSRSRERKSGLAQRLTGEREKRHSRHDTALKNADESSNGSSTPSKIKKTGGFLLDSILPNGHSPSATDTSHRGIASEPNGHASPEKRVSAQYRLSGESSRRGSPLSRQMSTSERDRGKRPSPQPAGMDPAQLVQMALNLSESRKRHVSSALPVAVAPVGIRQASPLDSGYGTVKSSSSGAKRASYLSEAPAGTYAARPRTAEEAPAVSGDENVVHTFSPATLSRAEKARRYFELASEHRRLLEHLPPLKSDATAPENYKLQTTSTRGSAHFETQRVQSNTQYKRQLGRTYNPLQALRNRRLRNRERRPLTAPPNTWQETDRIKRWIDGVEASSNDPSYRPGEDRVRLPAFSGELEGEVERPESAKRHRRTDTEGSVITRPGNAWSIEPAELLADTYWVEKGDNKSVIEDRHGTRIFPARARQSVEYSRRSKDLDRDNGSIPDQDSQHYDSEGDEKGRSRRRNLLPIPGRLRRNYISRSPSTASDSSYEERIPPAPRYGDSDGGDENIGPLDRHMRQMIAKEEKGDSSSPEIVSPDHWDKQQGQFQQMRTSLDKSHRDSHQNGNGRLSVDGWRHRRSKSADGRVSSTEQERPSAKEAAPDSPIDVGLVSSVDPSPSNSKRASPHEHRSIRSHLPSFRTRSKERNNIERTDFATTAPVGKPLTPVTSEESSEPPRRSIDSARPSHMERHPTTESVTSSLRQVNTGTTTTDVSAKESNASLSRRLFKGGRIGELVRSESSRLGDRFRGSRDRLVDLDVYAPPPTLSEKENELTGGRKSGHGEDTPDSQVSPRTSQERLAPKPKFYISNLPSFKSPSSRYRSSTIETPMSEVSDPFAKKDSQREPDTGRASNIVLPKINLPDDEGGSEPEMRSSNKLLGSGGYDRRKSVSQNNVSFASSTDLEPRKPGAFRVTGMSTQNARRHWSISDKVPPPPSNRVTSRDIARVRALLLSSGIKAHEICTKANTGRERPYPLIVKAFATAGKPLENVSKKEENVMASRVLSDALTESLTKFEQDVHEFQVDKAKTLIDELEHLSHRASEQLTKIVHETSDEADAFNVELTTKQPQEVKRVDDAVDAMFRQRRKQFRLLRRAGFKMLEWLVLGIMWWVWFIVVMINSFKKVIFAIVMMIRWLLWLG